MTPVQIAAQIANLTARLADAVKDEERNGDWAAIYTHLAIAVEKIADTTAKGSEVAYSKGGNDWESAGAEAEDATISLAAARAHLRGAATDAATATLTTTPQPDPAERTPVLDLGTPDSDQDGDAGEQFVLAYETRRKDNDEEVRVVRRLTAGGVERIGKLVNRAGNKGTAWNIEVLNAAGDDVTGDFACFQG